MQKDKAAQEAKMAQITSGVKQSKAELVFQDKESVAAAKFAMKQYDQKTGL